MQKNTKKNIKITYLPKSYSNLYYYLFNLCFSFIPYYA